jgi:3-oxoacyl-[acyl-carrier-protein] synthase-3
MTSDLALHAARAAIANAHIEAGTIDLIILATSTPDRRHSSARTRYQPGCGLRSAGGLLGLCVRAVGGR